MGRLLSFTIVILLVIAAMIAAFAKQPLPHVSSASSSESAPGFTRDNQLIFPHDYRQWIYLSSGLGMSYNGGANGEPQFTNVFVKPSAYRSFLRSGAWPDKTVFVLEERASASNANPNKAGHFQVELAGLAAAVKDEARFPERWAYFGFSIKEGKVSGPAKAFPKERCWSCHSKNAAVDNTFTQFYPTLKPVAIAHGTYSQEKAAGESKPVK